MIALTGWRIPTLPAIAIAAILVACRQSGDTGAPGRIGAPADADTAGPRISVGPNVHVTHQRPDREVTEVGSCADPNDPNELAISVMFEAHGEDYPEKVGVWQSHDGGATWNLAFENPRYSIDPSCAYGPDGRLYALNMLSPTTYDDYGVVLHSTGDRGKTWRSTSFQADRGWWLDRPWVAVDNSSGPNRGNVYFNAIHYRYEAGKDSVSGRSEFVRQVVFRSTDKGSTVTPVEIQNSAGLIAPPDDGFSPTGQTAVTAGGLVLATFDGRDKARKIGISSNAGRSYATTVLGGVDSKGNPRRKDTRGHFMQMVATDHSQGPFRDRVYVIWSDELTGRNQMWLTYSLDKSARRWSEPRVIDDAVADSLGDMKRGPHVSNFAIAVNKNGVVAISWADRRGLPEKHYQTRIMVSHDGGETWSRSVRVADRPSRNLPATRRWSVSNFHRSTGTRPWSLWFQPASAGWEPGQFWGISADANGAFHPVWIDDRNGVAQVWTAKVEVGGTASELEDLTEQVRIRLGDWRHDSTTRRLSVDVQLLNNTDEPLRGPFYVKWIDPAERGMVTGASRDANIIATNASNQWGGVGAVWQIGDERSILTPGQMTAAQPLQFRTRSLQTEGCCADALIIRVFGRKPTSPPTAVR